MTSSDNLLMAARPDQRSVSISDERAEVMWEQDRDEGGTNNGRSLSWDTVTIEERKESTTSFLNPALNFARRMSLRITGNRGKMCHIMSMVLHEV